jgi:hypothetical protein
MRNAKMQGTNNKTLRVLFVAAAVLMVGSCNESGGGGGSGTDACGSAECKLTASDALFGDTFGFASAIDGDELLIGAENHDAVGVGSGVVYAYRRVGSEYEEIQKIVPAGLAPGDAFGSAIAIDGDVAVIGARLAKDGNGSAYVFRLDAAGQWVEEQELEASLEGREAGRGPVKGQFGRAVAISFPWIAVGAPRDNFFNFLPRLKMGAVSMFEHTGTNAEDPWEFDDLAGYLIPVRFAPGELFGTSVALDGPVLAVGAVGDSRVGSITITAGGSYLVGSQTPVELTWPGSDGNFSATHRVLPPRDASGDLILGPDGLPARRGPVTGVVITNRGNGGSNLPTVQFAQNFFGNGATGRVNLETSGAAFVYSLNETTGTWTQDEKLKAVRKPLDCEREDPPGPSVTPLCRAGFNDLLPVPNDDPFCDDSYANDNFGISVAVLGDRVVVGADARERRQQNNACGFLTTANANATGGAYVYTETSAGSGNWSLEVRLEPADVNNKKAFGRSLAVDTDVIAVGAFGDDDSGLFSGAAYIYRLSLDLSLDPVWALDTKLRASDAESNDNFGISIGIDGERALIGAWKESDSGPQSGAAYAFDL